jgi:protein phosphatase
VPDIALRDPVPGERFLICSDGLTNELSDAEIGRLLAEAGEPQQAAEQLVAQAVLAGGRDNVTVIVVQWDEAG